MKISESSEPRDTYADNQVPRERYTDRYQGGTTRWYDGGYGEDDWSIRENLLFSAHITHFADNFLNSGAHEIKFGVEVRPYQHITRTRKYHEDSFGFFCYRYGLDYENYGLSAPYLYRDYAQRGAVGTPQDRYDNEVTVSNQNVFIQDHWMLSKNLTLHIGFRWELQREFMHFREELPDENLAIFSGMRDNVELDDSGLAPRLGLTYNAENVWRSYQKLAFDPNDPEQFVYDSPSALNMDNYGTTWSFHFSAFYRLPWDFMISTYINGQSGVFVSDRTGDYDVTASSPTVTLSNGRRVGDIVWSAFNSYYVGKKWGSQGRTTDQLWNVNLRLSKAVNFGKVRAEVMVDLFNVFNWAAYSSFETVDVRSEYYDERTSPQTPRAAQLSLKLGF